VGSRLANTKQLTNKKMCGPITYYKQTWFHNEKHKEKIY
jgi:hypothetical protein